MLNLKGSNDSLQTIVNIYGQIKHACLNQTSYSAM
jgi:hypothetical protein